MALTYSIVIPTGNRHRYLTLAISDLAAQDFPADRFEIIVVDDTPEGVNRELVEGLAQTARAPLRYERREGRPGINAARNTGTRRSRTDVLVFVDDDCRFGSGWLAALDEGVECSPRSECFGGPIAISIERPHPRWCGRDAFPITVLDHGPLDRHVDLVFGANFAVRRTAFDRIGLFNEELALYGDEVEWMLRLRRSGGVVRYVAGARVTHTRFANDVTLKQMLRGAILKGRNVARFDREHDIVEPLPRVLRRALRLSAHAVVFRCWSGATHALQAYVYAFHSVRRAPVRRAA